MAKEEVASVRLHPLVHKALVSKANDLSTTVSWIIEAALVEAFRDALPPGFTAGMPHKEGKD